MDALAWGSLTPAGKRQDNENSPAAKWAREFQERRKSEMPNLIKAAQKVVDTWLLNNWSTSAQTDAIMELKRELERIDAEVQKTKAQSNQEV